MRRSRTRMRTLALILMPAAIVISSGSLSSAADERYATLSADKGKARFGTPVTLRGQFPDAPGGSVQIQHQPAGAGSFATVATRRADAEGRFALRVTARRTGLWRAQLTSPAERAFDARSRTDSKRLRVLSLTRARVAKRHVLAGRALRVKGRVRPGGKRRVTVRGAGKRVIARSGRDGRFALRVRPREPGVHKIRVRARGNKTAAGSGDRAGRVIAYRKAHASWYGPGFWGNRTACGQTLRRDTIGVAHKTLPCGTKLHLRHRGRTVRVRVIDRGPYVAGREFDLTQATKERLRFGSTGTILASR